VPAPPPGPALAAVVAAVLPALRLSRWHGLRTLQAPIPWVLHLAYALIPLALAVKAAALLAGRPWAAACLHLQLAGAVALMILAVMTRAALGHTGRALVASPATVGAYGVLVAAALLRGFAGLMREDPVPRRVAAAACWVAAFALFLVAYAPMLVGPRADGKPG
jgi:uncharacterized protein involved in response to NO